MNNFICNIKGHNIGYSIHLLKSTCPNCKSIRIYGAKCSRCEQEIKWCGRCKKDIKEER